MSQAYGLSETIPLGPAVPESGPGGARRASCRRDSKRRAYLQDFEHLDETVRHDKEKRVGVSDFRLIARLVSSAIQGTDKL